MGLFRRAQDGYEHQQASPDVVIVPVCTRFMEVFTGSLYRQSTGSLSKVAWFADAVSLLHFFAGAFVPVSP